MLPAGGTTPPALRQQEIADLNKVVFHFLTVTPQTVNVFGKVTVSWSATIPPDLAFIHLTLNGQSVLPTGSQQFTLLQSTTFTLAAEIVTDATVGRGLATHTVQVTDAGCVASVPVPAATVNALVASQVAPLFTGSSDFTLKSPPGITVTSTDDGKINIDVPLSLDVPDWFDADMDVSIQLAISGGETLILTAVANANVSWSLASNLLSLGCTDLVGDGMTKISTVFLNMIVNRELLPQAKAFINSQITAFTQLQTTQDAQHRPFVVTSISYTNTKGLVFTACPK